jgi:MoaA/NifB/PqqE/SkfB family radical SAM enzyme
MNLTEKTKLRRRQKLLNARCILVNRTSYIHHEVLRLAITYHCNKHCSFCYSEGLQKQFKEHMSLKDFDFLCHWAKEQGYKSLRLLGGEPTIHPEFKEILDLSRKQGFRVSFSTNGLFNTELNSSLNNSLIESINFSYPQDEIAPDKMGIFRENIKQSIIKRIPVVLSGVIYPYKDSWRQVIDLAKEYRNFVVTRFSMVLPGHLQRFSTKEFSGHIRGLAKQVIAIAKYAYKNHVVFYFYRPLLLCMFDQEEIRFLRSISLYLFDTFCSCSCIDGTMMTINPDLTCFPCPSLSVKGIKITSSVTRQDVSRDFKKRLKKLSTEPLMDACLTCQYFLNYKRSLEDKFFDSSGELICHGGCFQFRD